LDKNKILMKKRLYFLSKCILYLFVFFSSHIQAQDIPKNPNQTDKNGLKQGKWTILYDADWNITEDKKIAQYYRLISYEDGKPLGFTKDFYLSGKIQWEGQLLTDQPEEVFDGKNIWYYENGNIQQLAYYSQGKLISTKTFDMQGDIIKQEVSEEASQKFYEYFQTAEDLKNKGNYQESLESYELALEFYENNFSKDINYANLLNIVAEVYSNTNQLEAALQNYLKADEIYESYLSNSNEYNGYYITNLSSLAGAYFNIGNYQKALENYELALEFYENNFSKDINYANLLGLIAEVYTKLNEYEKAMEFFLEADAMFKNQIGTENEYYATHLSNLASLYQTLSSFEKTEKLYLEARNIYEKVVGKNHIYYAIINSNLGLLYTDMGYFKEAEVLYLEAKSFYEQNNQTTNNSYATLLNNIALMYLEMGIPTKAEKFYKTSKEIYANILGRNHPDYAISLNNSGVLYMNLGDFEKSEEIYKEVIAIYESILGKENIAYAQAISNFGLLCYLQGQDKYEEALKLFEESLNIYSNVLGDKPKYASVLNNIGLVYVNLGKFRKAEDYFKEALTIHEKILGKKHITFNVTQTNLANLYRLQGNYQKSKSLFKEIEKYRLKQISTILPILSEKERKNFIQNLHSFLESYYYFVIDFYQRDPQLAGELLDWQLATKALIFQSTQKMQRQILNSNDEELIEQYYKWKEKKAFLAKVTQIPEVDKQSSNINEEKLEEEINEIERELSTKANLEEVIKLGEVKWQDLQNKLNKDEALVNLIRVLTFEPISQNIDTVYIALILKSDLQNPEIFILDQGDALETKWAFYYNTKIERQQEDKYSYNQYWQPLKPYLEGIKRVYFSPDGIYHRINLLTLQNPETKEYLFDEIDIQLLGSPKDLLGLSRETQDQNFEDYQIYLFGYPQYAEFPSKEKSNNQRKRSIIFNEYITENKNSASDTTLRFINDEGHVSLLEGTLKEVNQIQAIASNAQIKSIKFIALEANEENVKSLKNPTILHIATHGFFLNDIVEEKTEKITFTTINQNKFTKSPLLRSGLLLAGAEKTWQGFASVGEDGVLTAAEAVNLELENTKLVVLSACETGLGKLSNGEGVYGLQRAFQQAGAKNVIMSLWKVSDEATQKMMVYFYENHFLQKQPIREAFKNAQKKLRKEFPHPYFWGAFVLVGE